VVFFVLDPDYNIYMDERQALNLKLMREFEAIGVRFAFPTRTLHIAPDQRRDHLTAAPSDVGKT
jgi:small-conductance mechanosensitive channel